MQTHPLLSVIVLNWNGERFLPRCFESLREQTLSDKQVLLVDNGSSDGSLALTRRDFPEVDILTLDGNYGYTEANNRGAAVSQAKYLLFLNNDTWLDLNALEALVATAERQPDAAILAPRILTYNGEGFVSMGIGVDVLGFPCPGRVFYADGAAIFIRRDVFQEIDGFDAQHFMFFDETDLCWRAWLRGYHIGTAPHATIYHKVGGTTNVSFGPERSRYSTSLQKRHLTHRNQTVNLLKNYSLSTLCVILPLFVVLTVAEILLLFVTGQGSAVREAYLPAWRDLMRNRERIHSARRVVQSSRTVSDWVILRKMRWRIAMIDHLFHIGIPTIK